MAKYRIGDRVYWEGVSYATIVDIDEVTAPTPTYYLVYYIGDQLYKTSVLEPQINLKPTTKDVKLEGRLVRRCDAKDWIFFYRGEYYVLNGHDQLSPLARGGSIIHE